ncbi:hypothetical protein GWG54_12860 [Natronococcus sp. JC468]|uniref:hypothetical protein n=1 Tax=Natronococcus sp. JC468 TaxID=1961921 RepID=UPI00143C2621|nr:hypothetical protein [Natronococcus sp. JC468]NKE36691.1 hypothetical protein [Natronococcus sp. JC468]
MSETITVGLTDGREIAVDELTMLEMDNGTWLRCVRAEPSRRMAFDETTTYYRLETDVEYIEDGEGNRNVPGSIERLPTLADAAGGTGRR